MQLFQDLYFVTPMKLLLGFIVFVVKIKSPPRRTRL